MSRAPMTQTGLDVILQGRCQHPNCDCEGKDHEPLRYFHSQCHPKSPTWVFYKKGGILTVECGVCRRLIVEVKVAEA